MPRRTLVLGAVGRVGVLLSSELNPVGWNPPDPPPMTGPLADNRALVDCERVAAVDRPEDVAFDDEGRMYAGAEDDTVYRTIKPLEGDEVDAEVETFATVDSRPLGMGFAGEDLLVAATAGGLQSVAPDGSVTTLARSAGGQPIAFADDLHVADDRTVYLTDATVHDVFAHEMLELRDTGRVLAYDPDTDEATVELEGLGFANGVVPGPDGESLLVTETYRYRITRYWTDGDRRGEREVVVENLPGFPDNIDVGDDGTYWVAVPGLRTPMFDRLHRYPRVKKQLGRLPEQVWERLTPPPYGLVLQMDADGEIQGSLHDPTGGVKAVTSATRHRGSLYLGTVLGDGVYRYDLESE